MFLQPQPKPKSQSPQQQQSRSPTSVFDDTAHAGTGAGAGSTGGSLGHWPEARNGMAMAVVRDRSNGCGSSSGSGSSSAKCSGSGSSSGSGNGNVDGDDSDSIDVIVTFGGGVYPTTYFNDTWTLEIAALPTVVHHLRLPTSLSNDSTYHHNNNSNNNSDTTSWISMLGYFHGIWEDALQHMGQPHVNHQKTDSSSSTMMDSTETMGTILRQRFADVCFVLDDGGYIQAHRIVLAARCLYFRSMLDGKWLFVNISE